MAALTTDQLECLLKCVIANSTRVLGVFPADCVPIDAINVNKQHCYCFVLNTHPRSAPGEHWLAFFYNSNTRQLEYFDSFGFELAMYTHVNAALDSCKLLPICVRANRTGMLQSIMSTVCGHYCIAFLYWRAKHVNASVADFAHALMYKYSESYLRDKDIVTQLRAAVARHPCCATQLFGSNGSATRTLAQPTQSCCCRSSWPVPCTRI
jgi:hypothetical protein